MELLSQSNGGNQHSSSGGTVQDTCHSSVPSHYLKHTVRGLARIPNLRGGRSPTSSRDPRFEWVRRHFKKGRSRADIRLEEGNMISSENQTLWGGKQDLKGWLLEEENKTRGSGVMRRDQALRDEGQSRRIETAPWRCGHLEEGNKTSRNKR